MVRVGNGIRESWLDGLSGGNGIRESWLDGPSVGNGIRDSWLGGLSVWKWNKRELVEWFISWSTMR